MARPYTKLQPVQWLADRLASRFPSLAVECDFASRRYRRLEAEVPAYELPDPLILPDGNRVASAEVWHRVRRRQLLEAFSSCVYGRSPNPASGTQFRVREANPAALDGKAVRKQVTVALAGTLDGPTMDLLVYLPRLATPCPVPVLLGLNFFGNHTVHRDPAIDPPHGWIPDNRITKGRPAAYLRGLQSDSWPIEELLARGYGIATTYCGDIVPDRPDGLTLGACGWHADQRLWPHSEDSWGAIAGWAWGLSRALDYLETDPDVDRSQVAATGHSRLGKAALWAAAQDERFAMVFANNTGCGGAAIFRRRFGETIAMINNSFPHWFCRNFRRFDDRENELPVDQHQLLALIAPRPVYLACATRDIPADPYGEFVAARNADPVYRFLGTTGFPGTNFPVPNVPITGTLGYNLRRGDHQIGLADWFSFIDFAEQHFSAKNRRERP